MIFLVLGIGALLSAAFLVWRHAAGAGWLRSACTADMSPIQGSSNIGAPPVLFLPGKQQPRCPPGVVIAASVPLRCCSFLGSNDIGEAQMLFGLTESCAASAAALN